MVMVKAVMEEELVKPAAVEWLVVMEVKEVLTTGEEVKTADNHEAGVGGDGGHVDEGRNDAGKHGGDMEVDEAEEEEQEIEETEEAYEMNKTDVEREVDELEGTIIVKIINV